MAVRSIEILVWQVIVYLSNASELLVRQALVKLSNIGVAAATPATLVLTALTSKPKQNQYQNWLESCSIKKFGRCAWVVD